MENEEEEMNTTERLAFRLVIAEPNTDERTAVVCPRYEGLKIRESRPSGKMYYQKELEGNVTFTGVDFYEVNGRVYLGEMTFTPNTGFIKWTNPDIDRMFGDMLSL